MRNSNHTDASCKPCSDVCVPGGVYLCQVNDQVSCGACCGLYNVADTSRQAMAQMLKGRSRRFKAVPRTVSAIDAFAQHTQMLENQDRPFPQFHHCPYIGLIGEHKGRVGCLLHPLAEGNDGVDLRSLSYYGELACRTYFCPAIRELETRYKEILRSIFQDWHLYGLVVTEKDLINALFDLIERRLGCGLDARNFSKNPAAAHALLDLLALKFKWPYRPKHLNTPCHHFFFDVAYTKPAIDYEALGIPPSQYDLIFQELVSEFHNIPNLRAAEEILDQKVTTVVTTVQ